jgi:arabinogalactan endo-1,4-beta-galactosidase
MNKEKIISMSNVVMVILLLFADTTLFTLHAQFAKGADVGWLPQMEATGFKFYDSDGKQKDCLVLLKERGIDAIRLRVWVNPSGEKGSGHCGKPETVLMAQRAHKLGLKLMIDFHYSDSWADPAKQNKPAAWAHHSFAELQNDVYTHTKDVLDTLKSVGIVPEWVQVGNEIPGGLLWPDGSTANWPQLAALLNRGYDAVKAVDPKIKVIIHVDEGNNNQKFRTFFDNATRNNVRYDIIGMSYYPFWINRSYKATISDLINNMNDMVKRYGKDVMVVETGEEDRLVDETYNMLTAVINAVKAIPGNRGLGVFYWEPEGARSWSHYSLSCWQEDGKPSPALDAFKNAE